MCRFIAYAGGPLRLEELLIQPPTSLIAQALNDREATTVVNADGSGLGW